MTPFHKLLAARALPVPMPEWLPSAIRPDSAYPTHEARMRLAIDLSRRNVLARTGGPFGAAVFDLKTGRLLGIGVNRVVPNKDCTAHGEVVDLRIANAVAGSFSLQEAGIKAALYTSAEPCGMCCTAIIWGGLSVVYYGATRSDVEAIGFDEGLKPRNWVQQYKRRGIRVIPRLLRAEAVQVLQLYDSLAGEVYNGARPRRGRSRSR